MTPKPLLVRIVLVASAVCAPLWGDNPLFNDGPAFGGSQIFSEGVNPLSNPARFGQAPPGYYFTYLNGDQEAKDAESLVRGTVSSDPVAASNALGQLANAPWILRTQAYGFEAAKNGGTLSLTREEFNSILASPDLTPANLGGGLGNNQSTLDGRRAVVDRLTIGGGGPVQKDSTTALGVNLRVERWNLGETVLDYNGAFSPFAGADTSLLDTTATALNSWNLGLDAGAVLELAQGVRLGLTGDQLIPKHLWDVYLQPQFRAGLQLDLGTIAKLAIESDLNSVERMPFPVKQQSAAASLRFAVSPATVFLVGVEQKKIDSVSVTNFGGTLQIRTASLLLAIGFQAGQDRPMKGATFMFN
jgi:hypothetical protein